MEWRIKIRVWPEIQSFNVPAIEDFDMAVRFSKAFLMGIRCNPKVWNAHIISVEQVK